MGDTIISEWILAVLIMVDCYRCGWCGQATDKDGYVLDVDVVNNMDVDWDKAEAAPGDCCRAEQEQGRQMIEITRDMACDAGDPSLEGQLTEW